MLPCSVQLDAVVFWHWIEVPVRTARPALLMVDQLHSGLSGSWLCSREVASVQDRLF